MPFLKKPAHHADIQYKKKLRKEAKLHLYQKKVSTNEIFIAKLLKSDKYLSALTLFIGH